MTSLCLPLSPSAQTECTAVIRSNQENNHHPLPVAENVFIILDGGWSRSPWGLLTNGDWATITKLLIDNTHRRYFQFTWLPFEVKSVLPKLRFELLLTHENPKLTLVLSTDALIYSVGEVIQHILYDVPQIAFAHASRRLRPVWKGSPIE